jgi:hypothetical protein
VRKAWRQAPGGPRTRRRRRSREPEAPMAMSNGAATTPHSLGPNTLPSPTSAIRHGQHDHHAYALSRARFLVNRPRRVPSQWTGVPSRVQCRNIDIGRVARPSPNTICRRNPAPQYTRGERPTPRERDSWTRSSCRLRKRVELSSSASKTPRPRNIEAVNPVRPARAAAAPAARGVEASLQGLSRTSARWSRRRSRTRSALPSTAACVDRWE